jgi:hypothetical protein
MKLCSTQGWRRKCHIGRAVFRQPYPLVDFRDHETNVFLLRGVTPHTWVQRLAGLCTHALPALMDTETVGILRATVSRKVLSRSDCADPPRFSLLLLSSQQSLWPDCVAESELLAMST